MKNLIFIAILLTSCSTSVEFDQYRANVTIEGDTVYITQTELQVPRSMSLDFRYVSLGQGDYGITFSRDYVVTHAGLPHENLCNGSLGC